MPTTDLQVLFVLTGERGVLRRYSQLTSLLVSGVGVPKPEIVRDAVVVNTSGSVVKSTKVGLGFSVISEIVRALGGGGNLQISASKARTVRYGYSDVTADRVDLGTLDRWLTAADFDPDVRTTAELLTAHTCHVVVAVLKARALDITVLDEHEQAVALDVAVLQDALGANVDVRASSTNSGMLTLHGQNALAVAAKVVQVQIDEYGPRIGPHRTAGEIRGGLSRTNQYTYLEMPDLRFLPR